MANQSYKYMSSELSGASWDFQAEQSKVSDLIGDKGNVVIGQEQLIPINLANPHRATLRYLTTPRGRAPWHRPEAAATASKGMCMTSSAEKAE